MECLVQVQRFWVLCMKKPARLVVALEGKYNVPIGLFLMSN